MNMTFFRQFTQREEPAYEIFKEALEIVFDTDDGNKELLERLSKEARLVYLLWNFDGELHNGGFDQLFVNSLGNHCHEILHLLKSLNAHNSSRLLQKAMSFFPNGVVPQCRRKRTEVWLKIVDDINVENAIDLLNQEYYSYEDNLAQLLNSFVLRNKHAPIENPNLS